jgi:hypothetical protein
MDVHTREANGLGHCEANKYLTSNFLALQHAIDSVLVQMFVGWPLSQFPTMYVKLMPKLPVTLPPILIGFELGFAIAFMFVIGYSCIVNYLTVVLVTEKENRMKEYIRMMGMRDAAYCDTE